MKSFNDKNYYSVPEVSDKIGVTAVTIRTWCEKTPPIIKSIRVGGRIYIDVNEVDKFLNNIK